MQTSSKIFLAVAIFLILMVCFNIVAPSAICWLGFWKGLGTLFLAGLCFLLSYLIEN